MTTVEMVRALPNREAIENAVPVLISVLDALDGDLDLEDSEGGGDLVDERGRYLGGDWPTEDDEPDEDLQDSGFTEWHTRGRHMVTGEGHEQFDPLGEDNEDDDRDEEHDGGEDDNEDRCSAHGDGCGFVVVAGALRWDSEWEGEADIAPAPLYGLDQTRPIGPDNPVSW